MTVSVLNYLLFLRILFVAISRGILHGAGFISGGGGSISGPGSNHNTSSHCISIHIDSLMASSFVFSDTSCLNQRIQKN